MGHVKDHVFGSSRLLDLTVDGEVESDIRDCWDFGLGNERSAGCQRRDEPVVLGIQRGGAHPTGQKVSKPLAVDHGKPFFLTASWTLRPVKSIASAALSVSCFVAGL